MKMTILEGNVFERIKEVHDESVDLVVTSPPFYSCRDYQTDPIILGGNPNCEHSWDGKRMLSPAHAEKVDLTDLNYGKCVKCGAYKGEYGLEPTLEEYVNNTIRWIKEVERILKPGGSFVLDIGDKYASSGKGSLTMPSELGQFPKLNRKVDNPVGFSWDRKGIYRQKNLMLISSYVYIKVMEQTNFVLRNYLIWCREQWPSPFRDKWRQSLSPNFWFVKDADNYYFDPKPLLMPVKVKDPKNVNQDGLTMPNAWRILTNERGTGLDDDSSGMHMAVFPESLIEPYVKALCPPNGTVFEPFLGSGTTMRVALKNGRNCIGCELQKDYVEIAKKRVNWGCGLDVEYSDKL